MQAVNGSIDFKMSFYVWGMILAFGVILGRAVCGFLCPFGLIQELLYKIPFPKKKLWKGFTWIKYMLLAVFVLLLPVVSIRLHFGIPNQNRESFVRRDLHVHDFALVNPAIQLIEIKFPVFIQILFRVQRIRNRALAYIVVGTAGFQLETVKLETVMRARFAKILARVIDLIVMSPYDGSADSDEIGLANKTVDAAAEINAEFNDLNLEFGAIESASDKINYCIRIKDFVNKLSKILESSNSIYDNDTLSLLREKAMVLMNKANNLKIDDKLSIVELDSSMI